jgi:ribosomal protein S18 acetylase RimI-like enzyme
MIEVHPLTTLAPADLRRVASGYSSDHKYLVTHSDSEGHTSFDLQLISLPAPYVKTYDHFDYETLQRYDHALGHEYSFGAFEGGLLVGLILAEPHHWNRSIWVWEFHVAEAHRRRGLGKRLMECVVEKAKGAGLRIIVCETQNTNVPAIQVYRKLGFRVEGVDISYYSNQDYPDGEIAIFMKRRLP